MSGARGGGEAGGRAGRGAVAGELGAYGSDEHDDFVLDRLLAGLRATAGT